MKEIILSLVKAIEEEKKVANIRPCHVTMIELNERIKKGLRELTDGGQLTLGKVINDYYVKSVN